MEQNKAIFRIMLIASAAITVMGIVLLMLHGASLIERLSMAGSLLICNGVFCSGLYMGISHPKINVKYGLRRKEGRLSWGRIEMPPDPEGLRYRYYGFLMPIFALLMTLLLAFEDFLDQSPAFYTVIVLLFCIAIGATVGYVEYKLHKQQDE